MNNRNQKSNSGKYAREKRDGNNPSKIVGEEVKNIFFQTFLLLFVNGLLLYVFTKILDSFMSGHRALLLATSLVLLTLLVWGTVHFWNKLGDTVTNDGPGSESDSVFSANINSVIHGSDNQGAFMLIYSHEKGRYGYLINYGLYIHFKNRTPAPLKVYSIMVEGKTVDGWEDIKIVNPSGGQLVMLGDKPKETMPTVLLSNVLGGKSILSGETVDGWIFLSSKKLRSVSSFRMTIVSDDNISATQVLNNVKIDPNRSQSMQSGGFKIGMPIDVENIEIRQFP